MSKSKLKKELETFTKEQLVEVVLNTYSASTGARDYLEFFLNPDAEALYQKKVDVVAKELMRIKWGECKARISLIRREVKSYFAYGVGVEYESKLLLAVIRMMMGQMRSYGFPLPLRRGLLSFVGEYVILGANNGFVEKVTEDMEIAMKQLGRSVINRDIIDVINETMKTIKIG